MYRARRRKRNLIKMLDALARSAKSGKEVRLYSPRQERLFARQSVSHSYDREIANTHMVRSLCRPFGAGLEGGGEPRAASRVPRDLPGLQPIALAGLEQGPNPWPTFCRPSGGWRSGGEPRAASRVPRDFALGYSLSPLAGLEAGGSISLGYVLPPLRGSGHATLATAMF